MECAGAQETHHACQLVGCHFVLGKYFVGFLVDLECLHPWHQLLDDNLEDRLASLH